MSSSDAFLDRAASQLQAHLTPNVANLERWASAIAGGALLAYALKKRNVASIGLGVAGVALLNRGATGHCEIYHALGTGTASHSQAAVPYGRGIRVEKSVIISASAARLYDYWHRFENLPRFMEHLDEVRQLDAGRSHWVARGPAGTRVEWDAELVNDVAPELIAWRSLPGADVDHAGSVHFRELAGGVGTEVRVLLRYDPPGGKLGAVVARFFGDDPSIEVEEDLQHFKALIESGEPGRTSR
jgi:uncharacterized membrane protein